MSTWVPGCKSQADSSLSTMPITSLLHNSWVWKKNKWKNQGILWHSLSTLLVSYLVERFRQRLDNCKDNSAHIMYRQWLLKIMLCSYWCYLSKWFWYQCMWMTYTVWGVTLMYDCTQNCRAKSQNLKILTKEGWERLNCSRLPSGLLTPWPVYWSFASLCY